MPLPITEHERPRLDLGVMPRLLPPRAVRPLIAHDVGGLRRPRRQVRREVLYELRPSLPKGRDHENRERDKQAIQHVELHAITTNRESIKEGQTPVDGLAPSTSRSASASARVEARSVRRWIAQRSAGSVAMRVTCWRARVIAV
jgi:hypothetical protein